jgi:hypothetical protein
MIAQEVELLLNKFLGEDVEDVDICMDLMK